MMIEDNKTTFELMASRYDEIIRGCPYYYNQREAETEMIYKFVPNSTGQNGAIENFKSTRLKFQVVIICGSVLNLLTNWIEFFRKVGELLSNSGVLIISFDNILSMEHFCWLLNSLVKCSGIKKA